MLVVIGLIIFTAIITGLIWLAAYIRHHAFGGAFPARTTRERLNECETLTRLDM